MNWKLKAFIQNTLSFFPSKTSYRLHYFLQRKFGGLKETNPVSELTKAIDTWRAITNQEQTPKNKTFFEVGTGRISLVPLAYWLMGAKKTITIDINPYLKSELIKESLEYISKNKEEMLTLFGEYLDIGRWEKLLLFIETSNFSTATFLNLCKITYIAPGDAAKTNLPNKSIDFHTSSTVFEHIPIETLEKILIEGNRIIKNNGHFFHDIDYSDHFSHSDSSISAINFLSFSDKEWDKYARNRYMYMNRMRHDDFLDLFQKVGHNILEDRVHIDKISQNILKDEGFLLDDKFKNKSIETLSISRAWITSCKSVIK